MRMKDKLIIGKNAIDTPTDFETIQEGIDYLAGLPDSHPKLLIVKEGRYDEYIESRLSNFKLVGAGTVVISGNRFAKQEYLDGSQLGTFRSATFFLEGSNVVLENLHIENTAMARRKGRTGCCFIQFRRSRIFKKLSTIWLSGYLMHGSVA